MEWKEKVKTVRIRLFMDQTEFGKQFDVTRMTVYRWESGSDIPRLKHQKRFYEICHKHGIGNIE